MTFADDLRQAVKASGDSMSQIARYVGVSPAYLSDLMRGNRPSVSMHVAERLRDVLGDGIDPPVRVTVRYSAFTAMTTEDGS